MNAYMCIIHGTQREAGLKFNWSFLPSSLMTREKRKEGGGLKLKVKTVEYISAVMHEIRPPFWEEFITGLH